MKIRISLKVTSYFICVLMLAGSFIHARTSEAATYYVATNGNDSNPGTQIQPFRTLTKGVNALKAGDTLYLRAGVYSSIDANTIPSGTSWTSTTTIASYPGEKATLTPHNSVLPILHFSSGNHHIILDGLILDGSSGRLDGIKISDGGHHIRFINGEIKNAGQNGILLGAPGGNEFINCKVHDNGGRGLHDLWHVGLEHGVYITDSNSVIDNCDTYNHRYGTGIHMFSGNGGIPDNWTIKNSRIYNNLHTGILMQDAKRALVYNNIVWGNLTGILARNNGMRILNNTVYGNSSPGIWIQHDGTGDFPEQGSGATVANNIVTNNNASFGSGGIYVEMGTTGAVVRNNLSSGNSPNNYLDQGLRHPESPATYSGANTIPSL